jgi:hypothetical protein
MKGLMAAGRQVEDGEPPVGQAYGFVHENACIVGATVVYGIVHPLKQLLFGGLLVMI